MTEADSPPLTRRELRERERAGLSSSAPTNPPEPTPTAPAISTPPLPPAEARAAGPVPVSAEVSTETGVVGLSRKELRRLREAGLHAGVAPVAEAPPAVLPVVPQASPPVTPTVVPSVAPTAPTPVDAIEAEPVARTLSHAEVSVVDIDIVETVAPISYDSTATGPIHWTDALAMPADIDPSDPVSHLGNIAVVSDSSTFIVEDVPGVNTPTAQTGEIDIVVTGTIHLPSSLSETGALPDTLDSAEVVANEDVVDEPTATGMTPISASSSVSAQALSPQLVSAPPKTPMSTGMIFALSAAGVAGVAIIAVGVGALFNLF